MTQLQRIDNKAPRRRTATRFCGGDFARYARRTQGKNLGPRCSLPPSALIGGGGDFERIAQRERLGPRLRGGDFARVAREVGFTLVELILVIMVLGTLSYYAVARMVDRGDTDAHGFTEQLASTLRFAQKAAVAQRRNIYVNVDSVTGRVWVCLDTALICTLPLAAPAGGSLEQTAPRGVSVSTTGTAQFSFDAMGRPSSATAIDLSITASAATFTVRIEPDSGYVRRI
jgi:MSHA pilin protein MshC